MGLSTGNSALNRIVCIGMLDYRRVGQNLLHSWPNSILEAFFKTFPVVEIFHILKNHQWSHDCGVPQPSVPDVPAPRQRHIPTMRFSTPCASVLWGPYLRCPRSAPGDRTTDLWRLTVPKVAMNTWEYMDYHMDLHMHMLYL